MYCVQIFNYPPTIRKVIYTTNAIESLNAGLRKVTRGKGAFVNENALMKVLYFRIKDLQKKWAKGIANWANVKVGLCHYLRIDLLGTLIMKMVIPSTVLPNITILYEYS